MSRRLKARPLANSAHRIAAKRGRAARHDAPTGFCSAKASRSFRAWKSTAAVYRADPDEVRAELLRVLAQARAAQTFPWDARRTLYWLIRLSGRWRTGCRMRRRRSCALSSRRKSGGSKRPEPPASLLGRRPRPFDCSTFSCAKQKPEIGFQAMTKLIRRSLKSAPRTEFETRLPPAAGTTGGRS